MDTVTGIILSGIFILLIFYSVWKNRLTGLRFTFMTLAFGIMAFTFPALFISWGGFDLRGIIGPLVQLILFGMGMTLTFRDFRLVLKTPKAIFIGVILQYLIMPVSGFAFAHLFGLTGAIAAGVILIGSCPGGVSSNVLVYIARANVALSVSMTAISTLVSPLATPLAMKLLAGSYIQIDVADMMISIMKMIIIPLVLGILIHHFLPRLAKVMVKFLPTLAMLAICMIIAITISVSRNDILTVGLALFGAVVCHNGTGFLLGYLSARMTGLGETDARTVAIEVGIQNGGMATGLAFNVLKSAQAALGSAVFGPWSAISGTFLASWWRNNLHGPGDEKSPRQPVTKSGRQPVSQSV